MDPIQRDALISVTLQAQQWNQILAVLLDGPYRAVAPLFAAISEQTHTPLALNGVDHVSD